MASYNLQWSLPWFQAFNVELPRLPLLLPPPWCHPPRPWSPLLHPTPQAIPFPHSISTPYLSSATIVVNPDKLADYIAHIEIISGHHACGIHILVVEAAIVITCHLASWWPGVLLCLHPQWWPSCLLSLMMTQPIPTFLPQQWLSPPPPPLLVKIEPPLPHPWWQPSALLIFLLPPLTLGNDWTPPHPLWWSSAPFSSFLCNNWPSPLAMT